MAVVIDSDGLIASPTVGGAEAITTLLTQASRPPLGSGRRPRGNGNGTATRARPRPTFPGWVSPRPSSC